MTYLVNASQAMVASYKYDPYGRTLSSSGTLAAANTYRFSSKEIHPSSGLYYYGYRFYDPDTQRWVNRDPIEESGGMNLYGYVVNSPTEHLDPHGLALFGLYDTWGEYAGEVGDSLWGEFQGIMESLTFGLVTPCYTSELQRQGGVLGEGLAFVGETAAGGYGLWKGLSKKALRELKEQLRKGFKDAFFEELGQKTLTDADFAKLGNLTRTERGRALAAQNKLGIDPRGNWSETMQKGPTPLGGIVLGGYGGGTATGTVLDGRTSGD